MQMHSFHSKTPPFATVDLHVFKFITTFLYWENLSLKEHGWKICQLKR